MYFIFWIHRNDMNIPWIMNRTQSYYFVFEFLNVSCIIVWLFYYFGYSVQQIFPWIMDHFLKYYLFSQFLNFLWIMIWLFYYFGCYLYYQYAIPWISIYFCGVIFYCQFRNCHGYRYVYLNVLDSPISW